MSRREPEPLVRTHVWLFESDLEWLRDNFSQSVGVNKMVRTIIRTTRRKIEAKAQDLSDAQSPTRSQPPIPSRPLREGPPDPNDLGHRDDSEGASCPEGAV